MDEAGAGAAPAVTPVRVLLADDHPVVRSGLREVLSGSDGVTVVAEAPDRAGVEAALLAGPVDVLVLDVTLADGSSLDWLPALVRAHPRLAVLVLSMHEQPAVVRAALRAGARGYVVKESAVEELAAAVRAVAAGQSWVQPSLAVRLVTSEPAERLSPREREVLRLLAAGHTNAEVAERLHIGVRTAEAHRASLRLKTGAGTRAELLALARDLGLVTP